MRDQSRSMLEIRTTENWDRSAFATTLEELEVQEAMVAIERVLDQSEIHEDTRQALKLAVEVLRRDDR